MAILPSSFRVVATYTTLPSRYDVLLRSILSLKAQSRKLDCIYLTIPLKAARLNKEYPLLPTELANLCTVIRTDIDYGPLTKIYGALLSEKDPTTVIISCDDDVFFSPSHVEILLSHHLLHPTSSICGTGALLSLGLPFISIVSSVNPFKPWNGFTGFTVNNKGRKVDLVFGVAGVLYTRGMFPENSLLHDELLQYSLSDDDIFHNDDVLISGYLSKRSIDRLVFYDIPTIHHDSGNDALSGDIFKMISRLNRAIYKVKNIGFFPTMETLNIDETPTFRVIVSILFLLVIILLSFFFYKFIP